MLRTSTPAEIHGCGKKFYISAGAKKSRGQHKRGGHVATGPASARRTARRPCWSLPGFPGPRRQTSRRWAAAEWRAAASPARPPPAAAPSRAPPQRPPARKTVPEPRPMPSAPLSPGNHQPAAEKICGRAPPRPSNGPAELTSHAYILIVEARASRALPVCWFVMRMIAGSVPFSHAGRLRRGLPPGPPATGCAKPSSTCWRPGLRERPFWICMPDRARWESRRSAGGQREWTSWSGLRRR